MVFLLHCKLFSKWNEDTVIGAVKIMSDEMFLPHDVEGGMASYRRSLCLSFFYKFFMYIGSQISADLSVIDRSVLTVCYNSKEYVISAAIFCCNIVVSS